VQWTSTSPRTLRLAAALTVALGIGAVLGAYGIKSSRASAAASRRLPSGAAALELHVPHAQGAVTLDGDTDDPAWLRETAKTQAFVGPDGVNAARPYSEARFVWGDGHLYVMLYAADEDIHATHTAPDGPVWLDDSFHFVFNDGAREYSFDVSALGTLTDGVRKVGSSSKDGSRPFDYQWNSGAHLSHELDGTPNAPENEDEEWVIEMAIPFEALGLKGERGERIGLWLRRCDTPKLAPFTSTPGVRSCGSWGAGDQRGVLVLD
jgi:cellulose/xylan binding protein with CBM9 domain